VPATPHQLLSTLLDMEVHAVLVADPYGRVTFGNPAACALLGYDAIELQTLVHVTDIYHRPDDPRKVMLAAKNEGYPPVEAMLRTRSGELIPARVHARLLRGSDGAPAGTVGILEDQRELLDLHRRLDEAASQVIASERRAAVLDITSQSVNELSQPMMAAMGNIELALMEPELDTRVAARLERAYEQLERLQMLTSSFARRGAARPTG
jgi:PAS domain S-box-containing protein